MGLRERYEVDASQAERSFKSLKKAQAELGTEVDQTGKKLTKAEREARKFAEQAEPTKRVERQFRELATAVKQGRVSLEDAQKVALKYQQRMEGVTKAGTSAFGSPMIQKIVGVTTVTGTLLASARLYTRELEAQQQLFDKRVSTQVTVEQSRAAARRNMAGLSDAQIEAIQTRVGEIASRNGISETFVNQGLSQAFSASGGKVEPAMQAVAVAAKYLKDTPSEIGQVAGTLIDLSKSSGTDKALVNLGLLSAVGVAGRVVEARMQATNIAPALIGAKTFGGSAKTAGSLFAALTSAGGDTTGARTGTGLIALAQQLEAFDLATESFDGKNLRERVAALQANGQLAQEFIATASFEKSVGGLVRDLLTNPASVAAREYQTNLRAFPTSDGSFAARGRRALEVLGVGNNLAPVAERGRSISRAREEAQLRRPSSQLSANEIEDVKVLLQELGSSRLGVDALTFLGRLDGDGVTGSEVSSALRGRAARLTSRLPGLGSGPAGMSFSSADPTPQSIESAEALLAVADKLDRLVSAIESRGIGGE